MTMRTLAVLGSTGSIGKQTLEVCEQEVDRVRIVGLTTHHQNTLLLAQVARHKPAFIGIEADVPDSRVHRGLFERASPGAQVRIGPGSTEWVARESGAAIVLNGVVGAAGLAPSIAALERGARLALANKETLVIGAPLVRAALVRGGGELIPVDSEHSAALQCLQGRPAAEVSRLTLTASGGALRHHPDWRRATVEEVLAHPVWSMGRRITVDSALLFNKGLELIEARALFDLGWDQVGAVLHPEAVVHALASFCDGSIMAQAARPDMRLPIQLAISWPERWGPGVPPLDVTDLAGLTFAPIEVRHYPAFEVALEAGRMDGTAPCAVNAADEVAVEEFVKRTIPLGQVPELLRRVLDVHTNEPVESLEQLRRVDQWARETARGAVQAVRS